MRSSFYNRVTEFQSLESEKGSQGLDFVHIEVQGWSGLLTPKIARQGCIRILKHSSGSMSGHKEAESAIQRHARPILVSGLMETFTLCLGSREA